MAKLVNRLSPRKVASLPAGRHADGGNLYLQVADSGSRSWLFIFRDRATGKQRELGLGSGKDISLARARELAGERRQQLVEGVEPERKRSTQISVDVSTFGALAEAFIADHEPGWRGDESARQWRQSIADHAKPLASMPVEKIDTAAVLGVLKPLWLDKRETADRLRGRIERILDAAKAKGLRSGENPARWRGHLDQLLPRRQRIAKQHLAAMPYEALPAFLVKLRKQAGISPLALEFCILTAARSDEVLSATWSEFDLEAGLWTIPPERMKAGKEHQVPLSERACEILRKLALFDVTGQFVFPGQRPGSSLSACMMLQTAKELDQRFTVHGFRSTFRDWAGDCTPTPRDVVEAALAHAVGNATEAAYRRSSALQKRRALMEAWAAYCSQTSADNVVQLRAQA